MISVRPDAFLQWQENVIDMLGIHHGKYLRNCHRKTKCFIMENM